MPGGGRACGQIKEPFDYISDLPDEIIEHILGYLPITDAVRTSALKKKWRHSWKKAEQLNLDFDVEEDPERYTPDEFYRLVERILLAHVGCIRKISFHDMVAGDLHACLELLSRKGVNDLKIFSYYGDDEWLELPSSIYYCVGLSSLTLGSCQLVDSVSFRGFPNLVRLELYDTSIYTHILEKIICSCPLEILILTNCDFNDDQRAAISAPNLRIFSVTCNFFALDSICLKDLPNLKVASFMVVYDSGFGYKQSNCFDAFGSMPNVEVLKFDLWLHQVRKSQ